MIKETQKLLSLTKLGTKVSNSLQLKSRDCKEPDLENMRKNVQKMDHSNDLRGQLFAQITRNIFSSLNVVSIPVTHKPPLLNVQGIHANIEEDKSLGDK